MECDNKGDTEYSLQYFGFTPEMFFRDFSEVILKEMSLLIKAAVDAISAGNFQKKEELIASSFQLHNGWIRRAEVVLNRLEPTIQELFTVPRNVSLPVYSEFEKQYSDEDIRRLEQEVKELQEKCMNQNSAVFKCKSDLNVLESMEPVKKKVDEAIGVLNQMKEVTNDIRDLEFAAQMFEDRRGNYLALRDGDEDDDSDKGDSLMFHEWQVKVGEITLK